MDIEIMYTSQNDNPPNYDTWRSGVVYADQCPSTSGVLFIILSEYDVATTGNRRVAEVWEYPDAHFRNNPGGGDWYFMVQGSGIIMLGGWPKEQWEWIDNADPWNGSKRSDADIRGFFPSGTMFWEGEFVPASGWEDAKVQFQNEMH